MTPTHVAVAAGHRFLRGSAYGGRGASTELQVICLGVIFALAFLCLVAGAFHSYLKNTSASTGSAAKAGKWVSPEEEEAAPEAFGKDLDTNGDGIIDTEELNAYYRGIGKDEEPLTLAQLAQKKKKRDSAEATRAEAAET